MAKLINHMTTEAIIYFIEQHTRNGEFMMPILPHSSMGREFTARHEQNHAAVKEWIINHKSTYEQIVASGFQEWMLLDNDFQRGDVIVATYGHNDVLNKPFEFLYEFKYIGQTGMFICCPEREYSTQDAVAFKSNQA